MKYFRILMSITLCLGIFLFSCNKDKPVNHSECKTFGGKSTMQTIGPDSSGLEYTYNEQAKTLSLKHINAGFNCCPGEIYCNAEVKNDTIFLKESEQKSECDCNCLFDLDFELNEVEKQWYYISLYEPYAIGQDSIRFAIDLTQSTSGVFYVQRTGYPWGN